jgi:DNA-binding response OmpR family regulator
MRTIALIEDDRDLQELICYRLQREGYRLAVNATGRDAIDFLENAKPDLLLLDIMLPAVQGFDICREVRAHSSLAELPIIFLTARGSESDRVAGLELGANDYLVKPFFMRELAARIKLHIGTRKNDGPLVSIAGIELDRERYEVRRLGEVVSLTATEFKLLSYLMGRPGRVCPRSTLIGEVWGRERDVAERAVDICVLRLRQKLGENPEVPRWIRSVRGFGYTFDPQRQAEN